MEKREIQSVLTVLKRHFPNPGAMEIGDPYRTLVAVMLSARTRDEQVLKLLPEFFRSFANVEKLARATPARIEATINTIGMYKQKARHLRAMAQTVVQRFYGAIPQTMDELVLLPGVGRKTASVVLVACFNHPAIAVDTHVHRVTNRLGWVETNTPEKTERALLDVIPKNLQPTVNRVFVKFGRFICIPGKPRCWMCPIQSQCAYTQKQLVTPRNAQKIKKDLERRERELETLRKHVLEIPV